VRGHWSDVLQPGSAPPALLRARPVADAEEVLVLSYTADLRFFERVGLAEARAAGARVTVVHDFAADLVPAANVHHAGVRYTDVPVRCRSNGEFHPKLVVIVGLERAVVAIGSGNATASGWHHNGELWTILTADADDWLTTFHEVGAWLRELPRFLYIDEFGVERITATAAALTRHPTRSVGPRVLHNLRTSIAGQFPQPASPVTDLVFASPFLDEQARALRRLTTHFDAEQISFAVTTNASADPEVLTAWATETGADLYAIDDSRHYHGKLVQWSDDEGTHAVVGSANITAAAMLRTTGERRGNCELALLCRLDDADLTPPLGDRLSDADAVRGIVAEPQPEMARHLGAPQLLRALLDGSGVLVTLVAEALGDIDALFLEDQEAHPLTIIGSDEHVHHLRAEATAAGGTLCHVTLADGTLLGPVRVTDPAAVTIRPGAASPLEDRHLADVLGDRRLSERLFQALQELAAVRPATTPASRISGETQRLNRWRHAAERTVGSALVSMALGRGAEGGVPASCEGFDPGDVVDETDSDDDGIDLFDGEKERDTGLDDPLAASGDPVSRLLTDPFTAARLARRIDALIPQTAGWSLGALLALMRVTLLVAAGGGWPTSDSVGAALLQVAGAAREDDDVEAARRAAALVGLAVLATEIERWDDSSDPLVARFERCRLLAAVDPVEIDEDRVAHYAADLHVGFGATLTIDSLRDAASYLLTSSPVERATETLVTDYRDLTLAAPRLLRVECTGNPYGAAMRLLTRVAHLAPVAVHAAGPKGGAYVVWQPKELIMQRFAADGIAVIGSRHRLAVGPGAHIEIPPPGPLQTWRGPLPSDLAAALHEADLLP
jgi:hypothetical protein